MAARRPAPKTGRPTVKPAAAALEAVAGAEVALVVALVVDVAFIGRTTASYEEQVAFGESL